MNRTFQSRVRWHQVIYLLLVTVMCVYTIWIKQAIAATLLGLLLIVIIQKIINTEYVLTQDNELIIRKGRFNKVRTIPLEQIVDIEIRTTAKVGSMFLLKYILLTLKDKSYVGITPTNAEGFYKAFIRKKECYND